MEKPSADYNSYTLEDLIDDPRFILWVTTPDNDLNAFWAQIQKEYPQIIPVIADARKIVLTIRFSTDAMSVAEQELLWSKISSEAKLTAGVSRQNVHQPLSSVRKRSSFEIPLWMKASAAAVLLFGLLSLSVFLYIQQQQTVISTAFGQTKTVALPDGSIVTLNANSQLHYAKKWNAAALREVWIDGEAFFKVNHLHQSGLIKQSDRFVVHAELLNVEVLGTTFNVKNRRGQIDVALVSGKVGVEVDGGNQALVKLLPGELVEYNSGRPISKKYVHTDEYTSWQKGELHFNKTPLSKIFILIEDNYGYKVITSDRTIGGRRLSGTFYLSSEDAFLKALSTTLGVDFQKNQSTHQLIIK